MQLTTPLLTLLLALLPTPSHTLPEPSPFDPFSQQFLFSETETHPPRDPSASDFNIPTRHESTILARRLLSLSTTGTLTTIFPSNLSSSSSLPSGLSSSPIGLPEYIASCEDSHPGDPTILALSVSTSTKNAASGSNVSLTISWWDQYPLLTHHSYWSPANLPRMALIGYLEELTPKEIENQNVVGCFLKRHRDARWWLPGDKHAAHSGKWMRVRVQQVYWIGGFGDRAFIGWFDTQEWRGVSREEWEGVRLEGEREIEGVGQSVGREEGKILGVES